MADTSPVVNVPGQTRGQNIKLVSFAKERWSEAQQRVSKVKTVGCSEKDLGGGDYKLFDRSKQRSFTRKNGGVAKSPDTKQEFKPRRALFVLEFHDALVADPSDLVNNSSNIFETAKEETNNALARLLDTVCLDAIIAPVHEGNSSSVDANKDGSYPKRTNLITADVGINKRYKDICVVKGAKSTAGSAIAALTSDDLEDILYQFSIRDVEDQLLCTLTPELQRMLRKDTDFKNAENVFTASRMGAKDGAQMNFEYKGIRFIYISGTVLPQLSAENIAAEADTAANTILTADRTFHARDMATSEITDVKTSNDGVGTTVQAKTTKHAKVTAKSKDMIYLWSARALYFAKKDELTIAEKTTLPLFSHAEHGYIRVAFGAMLIDDNYAMAIPIKGTITTAATA